MCDESLFRELGRLEGRLSYSSARLPWLIQMHIRGIVYAAENAGVPVYEDDVRLWLSGKSMPPRCLEGLNDPISLSTVAYFYLKSLSDIPDVEHLQARLTLEAAFDHRKTVMEWAPDEQRLFEPLWLEVQRRITKQKAVWPLKDITRYLAKSLQHLDQAYRQATETEIDVEAWRCARATPLSWLASIRVPYILYQAGVTAFALPSLVPSVRSVDTSPERLSSSIKAIMRREVAHGHDLLSRLERSRTVFSARPGITKRSRLIAAADVMAALPRIRRDRLANALGVTPQGAGYLIKQIQSIQPASHGVRD